MLVLFMVVLLNLVYPRYFRVEFCQPASDRFSPNGFGNVLEQIAQAIEHALN
jgi:hypothetical protein